MADLTTEFVRYLATIYDAGTGVTADTKTDLTTFLAKDLATVRAGAPAEVDDANTMYLVYIV